MIVFLPDDKKTLLLPGVASIFLQIGGFDFILPLFGFSVSFSLVFGAYILSTGVLFAVKDEVVDRLNEESNSGSEEVKQFLENLKNYPHEIAVLISGIYISIFRICVLVALITNLDLFSGVEISLAIYILIMLLGINVVSQFVYVSITLLQTGASDLQEMKHNN